MWTDMETCGLPNFNSSDFCVECGIILVDDDRSLGGFCSNCYCSRVYDVGIDYEEDDEEDN